MLQRRIPSQDVLQLVLALLPTRYAAPSPVLVLTRRRVTVTRLRHPSRVHLQPEEGVVGTARRTDDRPHSADAQVVPIRLQRVQLAPRGGDVLDYVRRRDASQASDREMDLVEVGSVEKG